MEWYWWVLIIVGLAVIGSLKLKFFSMWLNNQKAKRAKMEENIQE